MRSRFLLIPHQLDHNSLLCVETVLSLVEYLVGMSLEYLGGYLLLAVCGQAVLDHAALVGD